MHVEFGHRIVTRFGFLVEGSRRRESLARGLPHQEMNTRAQLCLAQNFGEAILSTLIKEGLGAARTSGSHPLYAKLARRLLLAVCHGWKSDNLLVAMSSYLWVR